MFRRKIDKPCGSTTHSEDMPAWPHVAHAAAAFAGTQAAKPGPSNQMLGFGSVSRLQEVM